MQKHTPQVALPEMNLNIFNMNEIGPQVTDNVARFRDARLQPEVRFHFCEVFRCIWF